MKYICTDCREPTETVSSYRFEPEYGVIYEDVLLCQTCADARFERVKVEKDAEMIEVFAN